MLCVSAEHPKLHTGRHLEIIYYGTEHKSRTNDSQSPFVGCYKSDFGVFEVLYCESVEIIRIRKIKKNRVAIISLSASSSPTEIPRRCSQLQVAVKVKHPALY